MARRTSGALRGRLEAGRGGDGSFLARHGPLAAGTLSLLILSTVGDGWLEAPGTAAMAVILVWLFSVILFGAVGVMQHAEKVAHLLGEPLGTLVLTLSAVTIEVSLIASVMLVGKPDPALARDTMFAVLMIILNGMVGLSLLSGGIRHRQQSYNLDSARAFLGVLMPLSVCALILPNYTISSSDPTLTPAQGAIFGAMTLTLYGVFLTIQTRRHRAFFEDPDARPEDAPYRLTSAPDGDPGRILVYHAALLFLTLLPIALLAHDLAKVVELGVHRLGAPTALAGVLIATLILAPEGMTALKAAWNNHLQRSINILLGSALSTIGLTVPVVLAIGLIAKYEIILGLTPENVTLLALTMVVCTLSFSGARTDMLKGAVHLVLFVIFMMLVVLP
jgi:Ca2+:H+ antiporter